MPIKIYVDQGHNPAGYHNSGAVSGGLYEGDVNYQVGLYLKGLLDSDSRFEVRLSRPTEDTVLGTNNATSLAARVDSANRWHADYFISIHCNANPNPEINGTEMYVYRLKTQANWLAEDMMKGINEITGTKDNGIFARPTLYVLRNTDMPAVLAELGYITNPGDAKLLTENQYGFAYGIYIGMLRYFGLDLL